MRPIPSRRSTATSVWPRSTVSGSAARPRRRARAGPAGTFHRLLGRITHRGSGSLDRELIGDLIRAVDAVAARCDEISERLAQQQTVLDDAVTILGEELTRLRAESAPLLGRAPEPSPLAPIPDG